MHESTKPSPSRPDGERTSRGRARNAVVWFIVADIAAVVLIAGVGLAIARRIATTEAIRDARGVVQTDSRHVEPVIDDALIAGDPVAYERLDEIVQERVLSDQVVRVKVWDAKGTIVYSDDHELVGERYALGDDEREALENDTTEAELSDLSKPENRDERSYGKLLEVYTGVRTPNGTPLLFEAYLRFDRVTADGSRILSAFTPALLGGLLALFLIQIPLALALTRRVARAEAARSHLLRQAIESSERERRRIASDLHDSVVQGLAGTSLSIAAMAEESDRAGNGDLANRLRDRSSELRQWVRELRSLIVSMVPPRLHQEGLAAALTDLLSAVEARGIDVTLDVDPALVLAQETESLLFRSAQEAIRNVTAHARASHLTVTVSALARNRVRLVVRDDGAGIDPDTLATARAGGHVGLQLLTDLVEQAGGILTIDAPVGVGTTMTVEVPER